MFAGQCGAADACWESLCASLSLFALGDNSVTDCGLT